MRRIEIGSVLASFVSTGLVPALTAAVVASAVITWIARRRRWTRAPVGLAFAAVLSIAAILSFTLLREGALLVQALASDAPMDMPGWRGLREWSADGWWRATADPLGSTQVTLNIALFVPAGLAWTLLTRRPLRVVLLLGAASVAIEAVQAVTGLGANDVADIVANIAGSVVGMMAAVMVGWVREEMAGRGVANRRWVIRGACIAVVGTIAAVAPGLGASQRQATLADEAAERFANTSVADVQNWARNDQLEDLLWFGVLSTDADGFTLDADSARTRYPASFLGAHRCVIVEWDAHGVIVEQRSGAVCEQTSL